MAKELQKHGHRDVDYNRPNRKWLCGYSPCGKECPLGPSGSGRCRGSGECLPIKRGDRWYCTRPGSQGGECENGPDTSGSCGCPLAECRPVRTHRSLRKLYVLGAAALTVGFLLIALAGDRHTVAVNPGRLTTAHAGTNLSCESCHSEGALSSLASLGDRDFIHSRAVADSKLCLECHGGEIGEWDESAQFAHGLNPSVMEEFVSKEPDKTPLGETPLEVWLASKSDIRQVGLNGELACSTCHQEHHGSDASLTFLTDNQCQVCHQEQFHSFDRGHPTFSDSGYPYSRRTRIHFDHESHYGAHFNQRSPLVEGFESQWPPDSGETCQQCHEPDPNGDFMRVKSYEASCAKCHDENFIQGGHRMTFLALPEIESDEVSGDWPNSEYGLLPITRLLLNKETRDYLRGLNATDEGSKRIVEEGASGEIWLGHEARREAAELVAVDLQEFLYDVWNDGTENVARRLADSGFASVEGSANLISGLPSDVFRRLLFPGESSSVGDLMFPALDRETLNQKLGEDHNRSVGGWPATSAKLTPLMLEILSHRMKSGALDLLREDEPGGAVAMGADGSVSLADLSGASREEIGAVETIAWEIKSIFLELNETQLPFLRRIANLRGGILDEENPEEILEKVFPLARRDSAFGSSIAEEVARYRNGIYPPASVGGKSPEAGEQKSNSDDDFGDDDFGDDDFGDDDFGDDDFGDPTDPESDDDFGAQDDEFMAADDDFAVEDDDFGGSEEVVATAEESEEKSSFRVFEISSVDDWQSSGGWAHEQNAISYAAQTHADPVLKAWIEAAVSAANSAEPDLRGDGFRVLNHTLDWKNGVDSGATGGCLQCHTIDRASPTSPLEINWYGANASTRHADRTPNLTRFSHQKHSIALDCLQCHEGEKEAGFNEFFPRAKVEKLVDSDPEKFIPVSTDPGEFSPNFRPMNEQAKCATCHQENRAGNSCLQCHSYHSISH